MRELVRITWRDAEYECGWRQADDRDVVGDPVVVTGYLLENKEEYVEITMTESGTPFHVLRIYHPMIIEWEEIKL